MPAAAITTADVIIAAPSLLSPTILGRTAVVNLAMVISSPPAVTGPGPLLAVFLDLNQNPFAVSRYEGEDVGRWLVIFLKRI